MAQESNITGYEVRYQEGASLNNAEPFDVVEVSNTQTHRLEDLEHGTAYIVQVRAIDDDDTTGNGSGNWGTIGGESETTITASDPDQVDDLELEAGDSMITATWDPADGNDFDIIGYVVEIMPEDGNWDVMNIGDVTEHTFTGLMNGTEYSVRVSATSEIGTGIPSSIEEETPMADDTMIPTLDAPMPTLGTPTHDSVMVSWAAVEGATSYSVNWTANGVTTSAPVGMAMEHNIANLTPETMYSVSVCAQAEGMDDACSEGRSFTTMAAPVDPLDAPMPTLGTPTHDSVMVSWAAVEGATSYSVNWTANGVTTSAPVGMAMEHNITNLTPETMYSVSVCAQAEGMDDACSEGRSFTTMAVPVDPLDAPMPTLGTPTHDSVMVSWAAVEGATGYSLNYWMEGGANVNAWLQMEMEYTITGLTPETMYYTNVCASADDGRGACSTDMSFTTMAAPITPPDMTIPEAPTNVMVEEGVMMLTVTWEKPDNDGGSAVTGYSVQHRQTGGGWTIVSHPATARMATIEGLAAAVVHEVQVAAVNAVGMGPYSEPKMGTPMGPIETPALPLFGAVALGAGLLAAGRARMRRRQLLRGRGRELRQITTR